MDYNMYVVILFYMFVIFSLENITNNKRGIIHLKKIQQKMNIF